MKINRSVLRGGLAGLAFVSGAAFAERVADPFGRHTNDYILEGPSGHREVGYVSTNYYVDGEKRDDRAGDALLLVALGSGAAALILSAKTDDQEIIETSPPVM